MTFVLIFVSLLLIGCGFIVTEKNAKYLLSGYNTMLEEERRKVDIKSYIKSFRRFHVFLGTSLLVIGLLLVQLVGENAGGIFLAVYPIMAYIYFILGGTKTAYGFNKKSNRMAAFTLFGTLLFVLGLLALGFKNDRLVFDTTKVEIKGVYSERLAPSDIGSIQLVGQLPKIKWRMNGFSLGTIKKGYYKAGNGETVKLVLNSDQAPLILITKQDGKKVFFSAKNTSNKEIYEALKNTLPDIGYR